MSNERPITRACDPIGRDDKPGLSEALELMQRALRILDQQQAPADIGAHLDLAIERLKAALGPMPEDSST
jgi:hypothetical protein